MSELHNPLFENQKEFLERQKQEYKNALLSDVHDLKAQSQKVGKTLLIAGGALAGVWMISTLFRSKKKNNDLNPASHRALPAPVTATGLDDAGLAYSQTVNPQPVYPGTSYPAPSALQEMTRTFLQSDLAKAIGQQLTAFLLVYITKKIEEYLHQSQMTLTPAAEPETRDIDFSYHQEDAV
jgi:hypothetical protein